MQFITRVYKMRLKIKSQNNKKVVLIKNEDQTLKFFEKNKKNAVVRVLGVLEEL